MYIFLPKWAHKEKDKFNIHVYNTSGEAGGVTKYTYAGCRLHYLKEL